MLSQLTFKTRYVTFFIYSNFPMTLKQVVNSGMNRQSSTNNAKTKKILLNTVREKSNAKLMILSRQKTCELLPLNTAKSIKASYA